MIRDDRLLTIPPENAGAAGCARTDRGEAGGVVRDVKTFYHGGSDDRPSERNDIHFEFSCVDRVTGACARRYKQSSYTKKTTSSVHLGCI